MARSVYEGNFVFTFYCKTLNKYYAYAVDFNIYVQ